MFSRILDRIGSTDIGAILISKKVVISDNLDG